jgi:XcyI-like restriction endonuclease
MWRWQRHALPQMKKPSCELLPDVQHPCPRTPDRISLALAEIKRLYLQEALSDTVSKLHIVELDRQLGALVSVKSLAKLAQHGLRAELIFPVPMVFEANPRLLAYYRLLYGFSQKGFYTAATGVGPFKAMEERGFISQVRASEIEALCTALIPCAEALLEGIGHTRISRELLDDLTLLTVGPQLRGGANVKKGAAGIVKVFEAIYTIVKHKVVSYDQSQIAVQNAAGRMVYVEFAPDPDIIIREEMTQIPASFAEKIAIEVKAGEDFSNIHNRIGEAEKSHINAKKRGFVECWTVVNVDRIDMAKAHRASPSTNRIYRLSDIVSTTGTEYTDFRNRVITLIGI